MRILNKLKANKYYLHNTCYEYHCRRYLTYRDHLCYKQSRVLAKLLKSKKRKFTITSKGKIKKSIKRIILSGGILMIYKGTTLIIGKKLKPTRVVQKLRVKRIETLRRRLKR